MACGIDKGMHQKLFPTIDLYGRMRVSNIQKLIRCSGVFFSFFFSLCVLIEYLDIFPFISHGSRGLEIHIRCVPSTELCNCTMGSRKALNIERSGLSNLILLPLLVKPLIPSQGPHPCLLF